MSAKSAKKQPRKSQPLPRKHTDRAIRLLGFLRERMQDGTQVTYHLDPERLDEIRSAQFDPRVSQQALIWAIYANAMRAACKKGESLEFHKVGLTRMAFLQEHGMEEPDSPGRRLLEEELEVCLLTLYLIDYPTEPEPNFGARILSQVFPERWLNAGKKHPKLSTRELDSHVLKAHEYDRVFALAHERAGVVRTKVYKVLAARLGS